MLSFLSGLLSRVEKKKAELKKRQMEESQTEIEKEIRKEEMVASKLREKGWLMLMGIFWLIEKALGVLMSLIGMQLMIIVVVLVGVMVVVSTVSDLLLGGTLGGGILGGGTSGATKVCVGGKVNFTEQELSQYGGSLTEYEKNLYRLGMLIKQGIEGYGGGKVINVPDTDLATTFMLGVASTENSMEFFRYSEEKDITRYPSDIKGNSQGYGYLGLPVNLTVSKMASGQAGEIKISQGTAEGVKGKYKPESGYSYEMQFSPYAAVGLVAEWNAKYGYINNVYEGTTTVQKIQKVMDEWGIQSNRNKLAGIMELCITQAQYHGAMTSEHEAYLNFVAAMWVATSPNNDSERDMDKWSLVGEGYSESPVRVSTLGLGGSPLEILKYGNHTSISRYPTPDKLPQRVGSVEWALNGQKIGKPLWTYLWELFKDKPGMQKAWNQCYAFGTGVKARVLNFHYGINSYMQGLKVSNMLAEKMNLPTKQVCTIVGGEEEQVVGGNAVMPSIVPGKYVATPGRGQAVTVDGKTTEQLIAEYQGSNKSYLQSLVPHFGQTTGMNTPDNVWGVPFYGQGSSFGESWGAIPWYPGCRTYNASGCMIYALSYITSALTGRLINPPEMGALLIMDGGVVSAGASADNWGRTLSKLGLQSEVTARDSSHSVFGTKYFAKIDEVLSRGGLVEVRMKGPSAGATGQPQFASGWEHWIAITQKTSDGRYRIYTSSKPSQNTMTFTAEQLGAKMWRQLIYVWK